MYSTVPSSSPAAQWNPAQSATLDGSLNTAPTPPISPTSPTRRLRGLSYLRSYTQNHILSRDNHGHNSPNSSSSNTNSQQRPAVLRATSYPSPTRGSAPNSPSPAPAPQNNPLPTSPIQRTASDLPSVDSAIPNNQENAGSTSGWLPTVGGQSGVSRIPTEPQSTATSSAAVLSGNAPPAPATEQTTPMARTRSATTGAVMDPAGGNVGHEAAAQQHPSVNEGGENKGMAHQLPSIRFSAHQDPRAQRPSLVFSPMSRILPSGRETIKVGRYSERENQPVGPPNVPSAAPVGFKSKVVSRRHCEFWCSGGRWYIRDVKSSSGTFLNHIRLSSPGTESRPFPVNDGDIVQLGIDFKGGEEMIFRCVKIRVELNKGWQTGPSSFNVQSHKRLRELNSLNKAPSGSSQDCSICLGPIAPCQSLFVAPCSHTWHYKCIRVIINGPHWPHFICPNCRSVADLEAELDDPSTNGDWEEMQVEDASAHPPGAASAEVAAAAATLAQPQNTTNGVGTERPGVIVVGEGRESDHGSDLDIAEVSDDSDMAQEVNRAVDGMVYMHLDDAPSSEGSRPSVSSATTAPVDIISRKPVGSPSAARLTQADPRLDRESARTPSPNGLGSSLDVAVGVEGPMTPRNDAGPFIFDGSAGRASGATLSNVATLNLATAADTPPCETTPDSA